MGGRRLIVTPPAPGARGRTLAALLATLAAIAPATAADGAIRLREVAAGWGIDFRHHHGGSGQRFMVETVVGGVVLFDFDGDGDADLFFVDGAALPGYAGEPARSKLFRNDGGGRFVDVTSRAGIDLDGVYGCGATAGDVDGDGDLDLYVTAFGPNRLLRNRGDGTFEDVTEEAAVGDPLWSTSAAFADVDRDGDLDLYVVNYVDFTLETHKFCGDRERDLQGYCHPSAYPGVPDRLYVNRGDGRFDDGTAAAGLAGAAEAGLGVAFGDIDDDGWPDLYVANDADPNFLFRNRRDGSFEDLSLVSGTAYDETGDPEGSMGIQFGDVDNDADLDLVVSNFEFESNALYRNLGQGLFADIRFPSGLGESSLRDLAFGVVLADLDHDADLDVVIVNGHILDNAAEFDPSSRFAQENRVFENLGGGRFRLIAGHGLDSVRVSRGLAHADLDLDGDLELVIVNSDEAAEVYENLGAAGGWLQVDLRAARGNRFAIGARVVTESGGTRQLREVRTAASYLSQDDLTLHFGLGAARSLERLDVRWPGGERSRYLALPANRRLVLVR